MTAPGPTYTAHVALAMLAVAAAAALIAAAVPDAALWLLPHPPRPTMRGTPVEAAEILTTNLSVLIVPRLFCGAAGGRPGTWRTAGDLAVAAILATNSLIVGAAIGLHGLRLAPYLIHLPVEAAALTVAAATWLDRRSRPGPLARPVATVIALAVIAALLETLATPQATD